MEKMDLFLNVKYILINADCCDYFKLFEFIDILFIGLNYV